MKKGSAQTVALGGVLAALAAVIMSLGGLMPIVTFVCPVLCVLLGSVVFRLCGKRIAWAWYGAVAVLSALLSSDKEAVAVYVLFGYYPIVKPYFDRFRIGNVLKLLYFNFAVAIMYTVLLKILGISQLAEEYRQLGVAGLVVALILGNITFFLLDLLLARFLLRGKHE